MSDVEVRGPVEGRMKEVLTRDALEFVVELHRRFDSRREDLLLRRAQRRREIAAGATLGFLEETAEVRAGDWKVAPVPKDLLDRRVEITGPTERKMVVNALNSGARCFMADFEDANAPTWSNLVTGQVNLVDAIERTIEVRTPDKTYRLRDDPAVLLVRPRGWHLLEKHVLVGGRPVSGALFDFGLYLFHNHRRLRERGTGPYFYLPKMESRHEARLWNDVFLFAQERLGLPRGTIKATVLIETLPAALEMDEILHELREHAAGLNAGRWDYLFSCIKTLRERPDLVFPDRAQLTMTVPFLRAYTRLLVETCHRRGAHAMGGMSAFIPSRKDPKVNERALAKVREDKVREANDGFDGTWVAHPDLVPVAMEVFDGVLGASPNQVSKRPGGPPVTAADLLGFRVEGGKVTGEGLRLNVEVALRYLDAWLRGNGAVAIHDLMEDAATAEISRSQVWQWVRRGAHTEHGTPITAESVRALVDEEVARIEAETGPGRLAEARALFERTALAEDFPEFLTLPAYEHLD